MNPKRMSIVIDTRSGPVGYIYRPVYGQDRGDYSSAIPFTMNEVIHFRLPNPANDHWGLGPVEASEPLFNDFINEDTWRQSYWRRGALPTTLIIGGKTSTQFDFPGGAAGWDQMKAKWESDYGGTANAGKTAFLYGDWDVKTMGLSLDEMQALETRRWTVESIANVCGVPLSVFGLQSAANYATAAIDRRAFLRDAVLPYVRRFEQQVTAGLIEGYNPQAKLVHEVSGLISLEELVPPVVQAISVGLLTPNEGREVIGKEKVEDENMDKHYITAGLQPMEMSGAADLGLVDQQAQALQARAQSGEAFRPKPRGDIKPGEVALAKPPSAVPGNGQPKRPTKA
jgi:HK97 family phage portal protein